MGLYTGGLIFGGGACIQNGLSISEYGGLIHWEGGGGLYSEVCAQGFFSESSGCPSL
jgi:hypothetical protein